MYRVSFNTNVLKHFRRYNDGRNSITSDYGVIDGKLKTCETKSLRNAIRPLFYAPSVSLSVFLPSHITLNKCKSLYKGKKINSFRLNFRLELLHLNGLNYFNVFTVIILQFMAHFSRIMAFNCKIRR